MKFIKSHRYTIILLLIFVLLVFLGLKVKEMIVPDEEKATYGERLKDIEDYPISDEVYASIDKKYGENKNVKKITHRLQGRIVNYFITVNDEVSIKDAKAIGNELVTNFDEKTLSYYSIQVFMLKDNAELNNFPIIGMKDPLSKVVVWGTDREIVKSDTNEE